MILFNLISLLCTTIRTKIRVLIDLFLLCAHDHLTKMYRPLSFTLSFVYDHSTKMRVLLDLFILFVHDHSTKLYGPLSFILSLFCARPFDQKLGSSLINLFHLYATIRPKIRVPINLIFFASTRLVDQKLGSSLIYFFCTRHHSTKN